MIDIDEVNKKVNVSVGFILEVIFTTFAATKVYIDQSTVENRVDKRYQRHQKLIEHNTNMIEQMLAEDAKRVKIENENLKKLNEELVIQLLAK